MLATFFGYFPDIVKNGSVMCRRMVVDHCAGWVECPGSQPGSLQTWVDKFAMTNADAVSECQKFKKVLLCHDQSCQVAFVQLDNSPPHFGQNMLTYSRLDHLPSYAHEI